MELTKTKQALTLSQKSYEVRLKWSNHDSQDQQNNDLDLQCIIMDDLSQIEDVVYYNQQISTIADVKLQGDQRGTDQKAQKEIIKINLSNCSYGIKYLAILISSHDGITLNKLKSADLEVVENDKSILSVSITNEEQALSYLPCIFEKQFDGTWVLHQTKVFDKVGKTFIECEKIVKQGLLQSGFDEGILLEAKNWKGNKAFNLKKDDVLIIPDNIADNEIFVGLGWDTKCDIDSSILTFDKEGNMIENIYFGNLRSNNQSIIHHGDNLTGVGEGDDEVISIHLKQVDQKVETIWSCITVFTQGKSFSDISGAFCRLVDKNSKKEFCRYNISNKSSKHSEYNGCILVCIKRYKNNCWAIQPKGFLMKGTSRSSELPPKIYSILNNDLSDIEILKEENHHQPKQQQAQSNFGKKFYLSQIKGVNLLGSNSKKINPYIIIFQNEMKILKTSVVNIKDVTCWSESLQLYLKEGDTIYFKVYGKNVCCFDTFLGQSQFKITREILEIKDEQNYNIQVTDSQQKYNQNLQSQFQFNLIQQS
ncbi:bacterial stress protein (macronuclear) [Tetrahymena thermophila SB210]|uniref:Bacterial stress protein n=1 Tax=Tetrahymena thermophila (strain SB210) TaxID=312017 RepID=I7M195_TETTS|nr:bacterial stress protein [Tetrahymena thermophila SB210]EAR95751.1 bacterial stress protein [Tetrahymena thermophila SB210]|eukprot:XP_001015996.1 bacterial stress protein [Tetrahymena thermophila SB210]